MIITGHLNLVDGGKPARCEKHPAFEADYCPGCGTAAVIGGNR